MLARVSLATGAEITTHQTFVEPDGGGKAPLGKQARLFAAGGKTIGGGVWFGEADSNREFIVAEGIESTLSAMRIFDVTAGCAALSEIGIRRLTLPSTARQVRIFADHDELGQGLAAARRGRTALAWQRAARSLAGVDLAQGRGGRQRRLVEKAKSMSDAEPVPTVPLYHGGTGPERDAFLKRISELQRFDEQGARAIVADVVKAGFSDLAVETLIKPLVESLGVSIPAARKFWKDAARAARDAAAAEAVRRVAEQRVETERESVEQRQAAAADERDRLWSSCREIAESPTLLADMEKLVHELGVVGEGPSIRGAYLTASSRLCRRELHCACCGEARRPGARNFLVSKGAQADPRRRRHPYIERQSAEPRLLWRRR